MARFVNGQVPEVVQPFWAALQRGEFIADAAVNHFRSYVSTVFPQEKGKRGAKK